MIQSQKYRQPFSTLKENLSQNLTILRTTWKLRKNDRVQLNTIRMLSLYTSHNFYYTRNTIKLGSHPIQYDSLHPVDPCTWVLWHMAWCNTSQLCLQHSLDRTEALTALLQFQRRSYNLLKCSLVQYLEGESFILAQGLYPGFLEYQLLLSTLHNPCNAHTVHAQAAFLEACKKFKEWSLKFLFLLWFSFCVLSYSTSLPYTLKY